MLTDPCFMYEKYRSDLFNIVWLVVPSLIYSFVVHHLVVCIDPLLLQPAERMVPQRLRIFLRSGWLLSFGISLLAAWNIAPGSYTFYWREALPFAPPNVLASLAVVASLLFWLQLYRGAGYKSIRFSRALMLMGLALLGLKAIAALGFLDAKWVRQNLKSPAIGLARTVHYVNESSGAPVFGTPSQTFNTFVRGQDSLPTKIVVMLVESWGERPDSLKQMGSAIQSERLRILSSGFTTYHGATLSGEFRELCSKYVLPSDELKNEDPRFDCAPTFLSRQGYRTWGLHGYQKEFYARDTLWNRFGITNKLFNENLHGLQLCPGAFEGVCDTALIHGGIELLDRDPGPSLVYMLTLSSHEPLLQSALVQPAAFFRSINVVHPTQVVARRAISDLVVELERNKQRPCTLVYVASDHQPPSASSQGSVFQRNQVPFLAFTYNCAPGARRVLTSKRHDEFGRR
jgi:hypothetical protein